MQFECWAIEAPLAIVKRDTMSTPISVSLTAAVAADIAVSGTAVVVLLLFLMLFL